MCVQVRIKTKLLYVCITKQKGLYPVTKWYNILSQDHMTYRQKQVRVFFLGYSSGSQPFFALFGEPLQLVCACVCVKIKATHTYMDRKM